MAMSLEQYLQFFESRKQLDLTMKVLHEIICMHGFKKIHKVTKKVLIDAIETIDLIDPSRSTVAKHTSLPPTAKLEDVIEDLNTLTWQECCVTSIQSLNSHMDHLPGNAVSAKIASPKKTPRSAYVSEGGASASGSSGIAVKQMPRKQAVKRKRSI